MTSTSATERSAKADVQCVGAVDLARSAADEAADQLGVGEHLGHVVEGDRVVTHRFAVPHRGYRGWFWSVTVARASRAKTVTVNEVVLLPGSDALQAPAWVPWAERTEPGDLMPGMMSPRPNDDVRLEPGFTGGEHAADADPAEASQFRALVAELGLGRERVLSPGGRDQAVERWLDGPAGADNPMTKQAPATCVSCGFLVGLSGRLGTIFGACSNERSPSDGAVVSLDHGCGAHSDVVAEQADQPSAVWDTVTLDESLFD